MSRLSELAVSKRSVTLLLAGALFIAGISAWGSLKQELLPDIEFPVITVIAPYPGAGLAGRRRAGGRADRARHLGRARASRPSSRPRPTRSPSSSPSSRSGPTSRRLSPRSRRASPSAGLPDGVEPTASGPQHQRLAGHHRVDRARPREDGLEAAAEIARTEIVPEIAAIDGVAQRGRDRWPRDSGSSITLDPDKLAAAGVSVAQVIGVLTANNLTFPSGQLSDDGTKIPVSTIGRLTSSRRCREPRRRVLAAGRRAPGPGRSERQPGRRPSASPRRPPRRPRSPDADHHRRPRHGRARSTSRRPASPGPTATRRCRLSVTKTSDANTVHVAEEVQAKLDEIAARHPDVIVVTTVSDLSDFIKESTDGLIREGGLGALFAVLTIFLFLFSVRSTLVAAISIPLSILTALVIMQLTGISLNIMTLGGLAVAVGRVVDDAIVVLENIYRHRALGRGPHGPRCINGPREVAGAITASTLTTVAVFLPLGFVGGLVSQFFLPFALTVTFALLASLVCALTVVPVLAYFLIDKVKRQGRRRAASPIGSLWVRVYTPLITFVAAHPLDGARRRRRLRRSCSSPR